MLIGHPLSQVLTDATGHCNFLAQSLRFCLQLRQLFGSLLIKHNHLGAVVPDRRRLHSLHQTDLRAQTRVSRRPDLLALVYGRKAGKRPSVLLRTLSHLGSLPEAVVRGGSLTCQLPLSRDTRLLEQVQVDLLRHYGGADAGVLPDREAFVFHFLVRHALLDLVEGTVLACVVVNAADGLWHGDLIRERTAARGHHLV